MLSFRSFLRSALVFAVAVPFVGVAFAQTSKKLSRDLREAANDNVAVIIQYNHDPGDAEAQVIGKLAGQTGRKLGSIRALTATMSKKQLDALANDSGVSYVSLDRPLGARGGGLAGPGPLGLGLSSIATNAEYTAEPINAPAVWNMGIFGTNVSVAVIDSGITSLPDLNTNGPNTTLYYKGPSRIVYSQSFVPSAPNDATDHFGHGTHVAGLIAGNGSASSGKNNFRTFYGIAPNASLVNLRVLDNNGQGTDSAVIAAIEQAIALKNVYNIKIINLSLGRPVWESYTLDPLCLEVEKAWKAGIVVVAAAGNNGRDLALNAEGYGTIEAPGNDPYVITVGAVRTVGTATNADDAMASYSSKGPTFIDQVAKPDLVAPGNLVTSLLIKGSVLQATNPLFFTPLSFYQSKGNGANASTDYMPLSGTSMATGVASGAAALLLSAAPSLTPDGVKAFLMRDANHGVLPQTSSVTDLLSGTTYIAHNDLLTQGAGYLDINAAVLDAQQNASTVPAGYALSPTVVFDTDKRQWISGAGLHRNVGRRQHERRHGDVGRDCHVGSKCLHW